VAAGSTLAEQQAIIAIPRRFSQFIRDVWGLQHRLEARRSRLIVSLQAHERFRAAYDFLVLRGEAGEGVQEAADWWTRYQDEDPAGKEAMIESMRAQPSSAETPGKRRKRRRRKRG
jgi:poly(A) polymerase